MRAGKSAFCSKSHFVQLRVAIDYLVVGAVADGMHSQTDTAWQGFLPDFYDVFTLQEKHTGGS